MTAQKEKICREGVSLRENLSDTEQNIGRNVDAKVYSDGVSDKNNKHVIGQCRKVNPCYKVAKNLTGFQILVPGASAAPGTAWEVNLSKLRVIHTEGTNDSYLPADFKECPCRGLPWGAQLHLGASPQSCL